MTIFSESDSRFMALAVEEAGRAASLGEVPVGAVVVRDGQVLALECNRQITLNDPSAHAEMLALRKAAQMYLMFSLGRPNVWPIGDLAVREGFKRIHGLQDRPTAAQLRSLGDPYRPHRSALAMLCWQYCNAEPL